MKEKLDKIKDLKLPIILILVSLLVVLGISPLLASIMSPALQRILPLYLVPIALVVFNWYISASTLENVATMLRTSCNLLFTMVPILSTLEFAGVYADFREDIAEKKADLVTLLPMVLTEIYYTVMTLILVYNIAREGIYYETAEVNYAFLRWITAFLLHNTARNYVLSQIINQMKTKTYVRGTKIPMILNLVGFALVFLVFVVGRFIPIFARALQSPITNILMFIILPILIPIYTTGKLKKIVRDIKLTNTPKDESLR